jgi:D-xylose transport system substrate-binding protein
MFRSFQKLTLTSISMMVVALLVLSACSGTQQAASTQATATSAPTQAAASPTPQESTATSAPTEAVTPVQAEATPAAAVVPAEGTMSGKVALLLPETKTTRYESADRPDFEAKFKDLCPNCEIIYSNANQDANTQLSQAEAALTNGAQVMVLDPVDSAAAAVIADKAKAQGVPVIAYDRLILNSDGVNYYISFDNEKVGQLQAQSLVDKLDQMGIQDPTIVMINGSPTDNNAKLFKEGAHSVFDPLVKDGKLTIAKEYDTPDWSPDQAQNEMQQALTALGNKVDGVYAANDGTASGAIAAMKAAGVDPLPPVTGQDAELAAIQRILTGEQYMTVYKAIKPEADAAAELAYDLLTQTEVPASMTEGNTVNNGKIDVSSVLLTPVAVTQDNIKDTVVKDGFWTVAQICTSEYADACQAAGLEEAMPTASESTPMAAESTGQMATVEMSKNATLGEILTDSQGMTLYVFNNDKPGESTCYDACAKLWPPLLVAKGEQPMLAQGVSGELGVIERTDGTYQVTHDNMPLYYFAQDTKPGDIKGEGYNDLWHAALPSGMGNVAEVTASTTTTTTMENTANQMQVSGKIALLLPETKTTRYEEKDRPLFEAKFKDLCPNCEIIYSNANQDANTQLSQAEAALTNGAQVMVLDPVDSAVSAVIANKAEAQGVPVIAYDRLVLNSSGVSDYVSFDNFKVGQLQAQSLVDKLDQMGIQDPTIVMINGSPADNNGKLFKEGAHSVFDPLVKDGKLTIAKEYDTPDWSPDQAQNEMQQALTALSNKVDGVYAANDGTASGAIAAMKAAGVDPLPPVTGQDAELAAIQRILTGEQYMTVYKPIKLEADAAAELAYDQLAQIPVPTSMTQGNTVSNDSIDVPAVLLTPIAVTQSNINDTIVKDGYWTVDQICTTQYASACQAAGLH